MKYPTLSFVTALLLSFLNAGAAEAPRHVVFTYMGDPTTSLTANWQWMTQDANPKTSEAVVQVDVVSRSSSPEDYAMQTRGKVFSIPGLDDRVLARVELENLKPGTTYYLRVGSPELGFSDEIKVRTIPDDTRPLRFVTGGDMGVSEDARTLLRHSASYAPLFSAIGGDIAYANGKLENVELWDTWLTYYTEEMITPDGFSIPMVLAIGNHEVQGGFGKSNLEAPFFFGFFGQDPEKSYFKRQFGPLLDLYVMDSGHVVPHESQVDWLHQELGVSKEVPYKAAIYHVPLYPSHRDFMGHYSDQGRAHWAPVFDAHGLTVAFENHDHTFKRSHFIKNGQKVPDGEGTLYLGDGCWGRDVRPVDDSPLWYLKKQGAIQHFWVVDCSREQIKYRAVDLKNRVFDVYPGSEEDAEKASGVFDSIEGLYKLPEGLLSSTLDLIENPEWNGGKLKTILRNPFEQPVEIWMQAVPRRVNLRAGGFPAFPLKLMPGEERVFEVLWIPNEPIMGMPENFELRYNIQLHRLIPDQEKPTTYAGMTWVKILRP